MLKSINPANNELLNEFDEFTSEIVEKIINQSNEEFNRWRRISFKHKGKLLKKAAKVLIKNKRNLASLITLEMGKPILQSIAEVEKCAAVCEYYAKNGEKFLTDEKIKTEAFSSFITYQPLGVILGVMPWNFPFWQVFRFAAPTLMAGNTILLKHASNVSGCALAIENIFIEAGFPNYTFKTLLLSSPNVEPVIKHNLVKAISLTGSVSAGKSIASLAGSVLKKCVLELGGSDPYIILSDADLDYASTICAKSRMINAGQSCIAAKRFIVVDEVYDEFEKLFVEKMFSQKMGDPFNESMHYGPQARVDLRDDLHGQVVRSIEKGAKVLTGGSIPSLLGAYYPATVLSNVEPGMAAYDEELFGPVASLIRVKNIEEAFKVANDTVFGLGGAVFSKNTSAAIQYASELLDAGCCFVNDFVRSDSRLPFGGIKESGYGRELSHLGIREFVNIKTVYASK